MLQRCTWEWLFISAVVRWNERRKDIQRRKTGLLSCYHFQLSRIPARITIISGISPKRDVLERFASSRCRNDGATTARRRVSPARSTNFGTRMRLSSSTAESVCRPSASGWGIRTSRRPYAMQNKLMKRLIQRYEHGGEAVANGLIHHLERIYPLLPGGST